MKALIFFLLISSIQGYKVLKPVVGKSEIVEIVAIKDAARELFVRPNIPFDILAIGNKTSNRFQNNFPKELRFLVFTGNEIVNVPKRLQYLNDSNSNKNKFRLYVYFLHNKTDTIDFFTFESFTPESCNKGRKIVIKRFIKKSRKWIKSFGKIENKFRNFHGCKIVALQTQNSYKDKLRNIHGNTFDILDVVGLKANFSVYRQLSIKDRYGEIFFIAENNLALNPQIISEIKYFHDSSHHMTTTFDDYNKLTLIITKGERYISYEKLLMPFDVTTWCLLVFTLSIVFGVIFMVNQTSKRIQNLLYGESIKFPAFNVLGTFFGISQSRVPVSNFPRMVLMCFILFCLVIRTAYQGVFFELMAADLRKHVPTTIEGLLNENYTTYHIRGGLEFFKRIVEDYLMLDTTFITFPIAMCIKRNRFMYHCINEAVDQIIPAGIPQRWYDEIP
ncbi:hypothetical protein PVAND_003246 [Polypedilum vanderplanki]|uniref:Ionotropic receptor n=1 Tax=Polypedilum vanderplanki TaxID=319348 RepID=A0A9J6BUJ7_POLVA|nr:hypothetical protein PVAND_003246 [Polypedilum vanderplanki]